MKTERYTHRIAVIAYIVKGNKFLLMKRINAPLVWAPPGGRLRRDESPEEGLKREIMEETNLKIEIVTPIDIWFGDFEGRPLLSIDYLVHITGGDFRLSSEHSGAAWVSVEELRKGEPVSLDPIGGFKIEDFENAWKIIQMFREKQYAV